MRFLMRLAVPVSCLLFIHGASAAQSKARLRAGAMEQEQPGELQQMARSPAEIELEEESQQEIPAAQPQPQLSEVLLDDVAVSGLLPKAPAPAEPAVSMPSLPSQDISLMSRDFAVQKIPSMESMAADLTAMPSQLASMVRPAPKSPKPLPPLHKNSSSTHLVEGSRFKSQFDEPKDPAIYDLKHVCDPPCQDGRGICNDKICFCKTPYFGTVCQNAVMSGGAWRFGPVLVVGIALACTFLGFLFAVIVYGFVRDGIEQRMVSLGADTVNKELWTPSDNVTKKKARK